LSIRLIYILAKFFKNKMAVFFEQKKAKKKAIATKLVSRNLMFIGI
jgi:hypothetical protein